MDADTRMRLDWVGQLAAGNGAEENILCSSDDAAAKGAPEKLDALAERWQRRALRWGSHFAGCAASSFCARASAVRYRLAGKIDDALRNENMADHYAAGLRKDRNRGGPPYDAATATGMYDHD